MVMYRLPYLYQHHFWVARRISVEIKPTVCVIVFRSMWSFLKWLFLGSFWPFLTSKIWGERNLLAPNCNCRTQLVEVGKPWKMEFEVTGLLQWRKNQCDCFQTNVTVSKVTVLDRGRCKDPRWPKLTTDPLGVTKTQKYPFSPNSAC